MEEKSVEEKTKILEENYQIETEKVEEVLNTMCNLSDLIEEKGIENGIEKGMTEAIVMSLQNLMETMGFSLEKACQALKVPVEEYEKILNHKL